MKIMDRIDILLVPENNEPVKVRHDELIDKLNELYARNAHKAYDTFYVMMEKDQKLGWALLFEGAREESNEEKQMREAKEALEKKRVEEAELKEYLRLHKKYGKK